MCLSPKSHEWLQKHFLCKRSLSFRRRLTTGSQKSPQPTLATVLPSDHHPSADQVALAQQAHPLWAGGHRGAPLRCFSPSTPCVDPFQLCGIGHGMRPGCTHELPWPTHLIQRMLICVDDPACPLTSLCASTTPHFNPHARPGACAQPSVRRLTCTSQGLSTLSVPPKPHV